MAQETRITGGANEYDESRPRKVKIVLETEVEERQCEYCGKWFVPLFTKAGSMGAQRSPKWILSNRKTCSHSCAAYLKGEIKSEQMQRMKAEEPERFARVQARDWVALGKASAAKGRSDKWRESLKNKAPYKRTARRGKTMCKCEHTLNAHWRTDDGGKSWQCSLCECRKFEDKAAVRGG